MAFFSSCGSDDSDDVKIQNLTVKDEVEGTWAANSIVTIENDVVIPEGKTLTVEEGVTVIVKGTGLAASPEITVKGSLLVMGTEGKRVKITVPEASRTKENALKGLWGGIQATSTAKNVVFKYADVEYAGAPAPAGHALVTAGVYEEGEFRYGFYFANDVDGKVVIDNSRFAYTSDDGMRINGGDIAITNSVFELCGNLGGEAINIKGGTTGEVAFNLFYECATNGVKYSGFPPSTNKVTTVMSVYNNTFINCGWRRDKAGRGGSITAESSSQGKIYNNMVVNCKYGVRIDATIDSLGVKTFGADIDNTNVGFTFYYGADSLSSTQFHPTISAVGTSKNILGEDQLPKETNNDIKGKEGENDPKFVSFAITGFKPATASAGSFELLNSSSDFKLASGSPALTGAKAGAVPASTLTVNGVTYDVAASAAYFGAFGE